MIGVLLSAQGSEADFGIQSTHIPDPKVQSSWTKPTPRTRNPKGSGVIMTKYTKQGICFPTEKIHQKSAFHEHKKNFP